MPAGNLFVVSPTGVIVDKASTVKGAKKVVAKHAKENDVKGLYKVLSFKVEFNSENMEIQTEAVLKTEEPKKTDKPHFD